jgi:hypothetical protein
MFAQDGRAASFEPLEEDNGVVLGVSDDFGSIIAHKDEATLDVSVPFGSVNILSCVSSCEH